MLLEYFFKRACYRYLKDHTVFKTLYKTIRGDWTEDSLEGNWHPWSSSPHAALVCDIKHEHYYMIDGVRYDDIESALVAAEYEIYKPYLLEFIINTLKEISKHKKTLRRLTFHKEVKPCLRV